MVNKKVEERRQRKLDRQAQKSSRMFQSGIYITDFKGMDFDIWYIDF